MARLVLSECCGLAPLRLRAGRGAIAAQSSAPAAALSASTALPPRGPAAIHRDWALRVSAPTRLTSVVEEEGKGTASPLLGEEADAGGEFFDPGAAPPFGLAEIRAAIPKHCWVKDPWRSMSYVLRDVLVVLGLAAAAARIDSWLVWPLYWAAQGTMFWALFVLGHDCGHGSFSNNVKLNSVVGHILHSSILVPYNGWRISHRTHHQNHGHFKRSPGKAGSHFDPSSELFQPNEKKDIITSTASWLTMVGVLAGLTFVMGPIQMLKLYAVPYLIWSHTCTIMAMKTSFLGTAESYLRGGLTTLDRDYGWINNVHHDIGTHVIHHLFPQIPHYHLIEATEAAKPVLGKYYKEPKKSGPLPLHLFGVLSESLKQDHYVSDTGDVVYYQTDKKMT
nr:unnamed protein product [Digitaria exilis]